jgi:hypothetical protein
MTFTAKYSGHCNADDCAYGDRQIRQGDSVAYVDDELCHALCVKRCDRMTPCPSCGLQHRGECDW